MNDSNHTTATSAVCFACKLEKPASAFSRMRARTNGLSHKCKACRSASRISAAEQERRAFVAQGMLRCCKCNVVKPATVVHFRARSRSPLGVEAHCRACRSGKALSPTIAHRRQLASRGIKPCGVCKRDLPFAEFRMGSGKRRASDCYDCHRDAEKIRQQLPHVAHAKKLQSRVYAADPTNTMKIRARNEVNKAVQRGDLARLPCASCGATKADAHHHAGYDEANWFNVEWLCRRCHLREHRKTG
jgi:hypothetical protein